MLRYALDGGNFTRAELIIDQIEERDLTTIQLLEFNYRKARYFQLNQQLSKSITYFLEVIEQGEKF